MDKIIPLSRLVGDNILDKSPNYSWYSDATLLETLDPLIPPRPPIGRPLRLPLQPVDKLTGIGTVRVGRLESEILRIRQKIVVGPSEITGDVASIKMHHTVVPEIVPGD
jgi:elongation factor 1-alpha